MKQTRITSNVKSLEEMQLHIHTKNADSVSFGLVNGWANERINFKTERIGASIT
jgi:hypothetical protein